MADDWLKMRTNLRRHPKVVRIVSALRTDRLRVVGALHAVWSVFDEHSIDGVLPGYSFEMMDQEIGWPGFSKAMHDIDWLDRDGDCGLKLPEFSTHNGASAKRRAEDAKRKRREREARPDDVPPPSKKIRTKSGLEKEREKKDISKEANASLAPKLELVVSSPTPTNPPSASNGDTPTAAVWRAYSAAYQDRYGVAPLRNAKVNGQLANFVTRVPAVEAPLVADWYVRSSRGLYVSAKHAIDLLLRDAEALRTEWATRTHTTDTQARQADRTAATGSVIHDLIEEFHGTQQSPA